MRLPVERSDARDGFQDSHAGRPRRRGRAATIAAGLTRPTVRRQRAETIGTGTRSAPPEASPPARAAAWASPKP